MQKAETNMSLKSSSCSCSTNVSFSSANSGWTSGKLTCTAFSATQGTNFTDFKMSSILMMVNEQSIDPEKNKFLESFDASCMVCLCSVCNKNVYRASSMETATVDDISVISQVSQTGKGFNSFLRNIFISNAIVYCQITLIKASLLGQVLAGSAAGPSSSSSSSSATASTILKCDGVLFAVGSSQGMLLIYHPERDMKRTVWDVYAVLSRRPLLSNRITAASSKGGRNFQLLNKQFHQVSHQLLDVTIGRGKSTSSKFRPIQAEPSKLAIHQDDLSQLCVEDNMNVAYNTDSRMEIKSNGSSKFDSGREADEASIQRLSQDSNTRFTIPPDASTTTTIPTIAMDVDEVVVTEQGNPVEIQAAEEEQEDNATVTTLIDPEEGLDMLIHSAMEIDQALNATEQPQVEQLLTTESTPPTADRELKALAIVQKQLQALPESIQRLLIDCIEGGYGKCINCASQLLHLALQPPTSIATTKKKGKKQANDHSKQSKKVINNIVKLFKTVLKSRLGTDANLLAMISRTAMLYIHFLLAVGHEQLKAGNESFCSFENTSEYLSDALDRMQLALGSPHFPIHQAEQLLLDPNIALFTTALPSSQQQDLNAIEIMRKVIGQIRTVHGHTSLWSHVRNEIDARALKSQSPSPAKAPLQVMKAESRADSGSSVPPPSQPVVEQFQEAVPAEQPTEVANIPVPPKAVMRRQNSLTSVKTLINYHAGRGVNKAVTMLPKPMQNISAKQQRQPFVQNQQQRRVSPRRISATTFQAKSTIAPPQLPLQPLTQDLDVVPVVPAVGKQAKRTRSLPSNSKHRLLSPSPKKRKIVLPSASHGNDENALFASPSRLIHSPMVEPGTESLFERQRADDTLRSPAEYVQTNLFSLES